MPLLRREFFGRRRTYGDRHARDDWTPGGQWMGDYMKGAFFYADFKLHFLGAWPVPVKSELRYNIVQLPSQVNHLGTGKAVQAKPNPQFLENRVPPGQEDHFFTQGGVR